MTQMQQITVATDLRERIVAEGGHTALINVIKDGIVAVDSAHVRPSLEGDAASSTALQAMAVCALASLALKSSHAAGINTSGGTAVLVDLLIHFQYLSDGALAVLQTQLVHLRIWLAVHDMAHGSKGIARSILAAHALQPLLVLTLHQDVEVVRHTRNSRAGKRQVDARRVPLCRHCRKLAKYLGGLMEAMQKHQHPEALILYSAGTGSAYSESSAGTRVGAALRLSTMSPHRNYRSKSTDMIRTIRSPLQPQIILECDGVGGCASLRHT